jgi:hypothetical protein
LKVAAFFTSVAAHMNPNSKEFFIYFSFELSCVCAISFTNSRKWGTNSLAHIIWEVNVVRTNDLKLGNLNHERWVLGYAAYRML